MLYLVNIPATNHRRLASIPYYLPQRKEHAMRTSNFGLEAQQSLPSIIHLPVYRKSGAHDTLGIVENIGTRHIQCSDCCI
ncbi:hypothetical protein VTK56DRAFT_5746 [Thermocarpiscus australiensis]